MNPKGRCGTICIHIYLFGIIACITFLCGLTQAKEIQKEGGHYIEKPLEEISSDSEVVHSVAERSGSEVIRGRSRIKRAAQVTYAQQILDDAQIQKADATLRGIANFLQQELIKVNGGP